jgi:CubicO group peptidase (beta-lactamase class C family)
LRDLLTHRTGLPRHDWVHMGGQLDNAGMLTALSHLEPNKPFRRAYQYRNLMYLVAGLVLELADSRDQRAGVIED